MEKTTATLREEAAEAASNLEWQRAADLFEMAIANYPSNGGELARRDIARLQEKKAGCLAMLENETD